jgi:hypothetical protein
VDKLNTTLAKFTQGSKILNTILINQICVFNKRGLGYQLKKNQKYLKNYFVKAKKSYNPNQTCHYCRSIGHLIYTCPMKEDKVGNMTWVLKGTTTNKKRLMKVWVSKTSSWFYVCRNQGNMENCSRIVLAQDIWPKMIHCFQA